MKDSHHTFKTLTLSFSMQSKHDTDDVPICMESRDVPTAALAEPGPLFPGKAKGNEIFMPAGTVPWELAG